ncbi:PA14 domain protein [Polystyrenella longa]|uniref:PA14 domain protein n=1 Tax=Polystyrenella longa TaxID=2528007 RepID=A0A518CTK0_9PLAN|nr:DUF1592 domain-containing protein [Polystyrenella longa]QDU82546.1 PA14 domain protein [Polystyrenella longa]
MPRLGSNKPVPPRLKLTGIAAQLLVMFLMLSTLVYGDDAATPEPQSKPSEYDQLLARGEAIWKKSCVECHGENGEGVELIYEMALVGDDTVGQLTEVIEGTMPKDAAEDCVGEDAEAVAAWIHHSFYSEAARLRNRPAQIKLVHLTANQLRQSLADLYGQFGGNIPKDDKRGVLAEYFDGSNRNKDKLKVKRFDPVINFDWENDSPGDDIQSEAFFVHWRAGLKVEETGKYEIVVRSTAAFKMYFGRFGRLFIDNHVQSGDKTEFRKTMTLLAGRVYPLQIDLYQRKRKTEQPPVKVSLSWTPPHGTEEVIPNRNLVPVMPPATFALQTNLPPDDRSYGYDRGLAVDRSWDESTTLAAAEFASIVVDELWPDYQNRHKEEPNVNRARLRAFITELAEVAFRGPLSDEERQFYIDEQIAATEDDALAIQRCLLTILKSPRFLYPDLDRDRSVSQQAANRLALTLFDSLPSDTALREAVTKNELETEEQIRTMAQQMVNDYRCEGKMLEMLFEWLNLSHLGDIAKDSEKFPNFDQALVADLRASLKVTLEDAVIDSDSDFRQLFDADSVYTNRRLAEFYGDAWASPQFAIEDAEAVKANALSDPNKPARAERPPAKSAEDYFGLIPVSDFVKTEASAPYNHGILSHPYLMSGLAYSETTSPIHRGVFLIRYMLGRTLKPPNAAFTPLSPDLHPNLTTRERVNLQTGSETCQVCHAKINPLGFTLEGFDAVGRFREKEGENLVDSTGSYIDRNGENTTFNGADDLAQYLSGSEDAHRAFVHRTFQHFVKQPIAAYGPNRLDELMEKFRSENYDLRKLLVEIAVIAAQPTTSNTPASREQTSSTSSPNSAPN